MKGRRWGPSPRPFNEALADGGRPRQNGPTVQEALQVVSQFAAGRVAVTRRLLQTFQADRFQFNRRSALEFRRRDGLFGKNLLHGDQRRLPLERGPPREQFIKNSAERINIRGGTYLIDLAGRLLG